MHYDALCTRSDLTPYGVDDRRTDAYECIVKLNSNTVTSASHLRALNVQLKVHVLTSSSRIDSARQYWIV